MNRDTAGNANLPIGCVGPGHRGWHDRRYLPHFDSDEAIQHVTFHLADSLAKEVLQRLEEEIKAIPPARQDVERRRRVEAWIDAGHGSCVLREPSIARMVEDSLLFFDAQRYRLKAWVVMPNHVHVLVQPVNGWSVAKIVASWKKFTARRICDYRGSANRNANLPIGSIEKDANPEIGVPTATRESGVPGPIWHREYWDRYMRNESHFQQAIEYIHQNPVKAGLVAKAEDWPWSSARFGNGEYAGQKLANQEIGGPTANQETCPDANYEIGNPVANQEIGDPTARQEIGGPRNANLPIGSPGPGD